MRVLVTGAAGSCGAELAQGLLAAGHEVRGFDVRVPEPAPDFDFVQGDLADLPKVETAVKGVEAVCHLGAIPAPTPREEWPKIMQANVVGTFNVMEAASRLGAKKVVYASSICANGWYANPAKRPEYYPVDEDHPSSPEEPYGLSKLMGEMLGRMYVDYHGLHVICLRLANVAVETESKGAADLATPVHWTRVARRDVAHAFMAALESDRPFAVYNIGSKHLYDAEGKIRDGETLLNEVTEWGVDHVHDQAYLDAGRPFISSQKAQEEIGYKPEF